MDDAVESEGVVDIFAAAGLERPDISALDDGFLQTFKDKPHQNLRLVLLEQLLFDEIRRRQPRNLVQAKSVRELLEKTLQRYHNRLIDAAAVVAEMLRMKKDMDASDVRAQGLGLAEEEVAFYDAVAQNAATVYDQPSRGRFRAVHRTVHASGRSAVRGLAAGCVMPSLSISGFTP